MSTAENEVQAQAEAEAPAKAKRVSLVEKEIDLEAGKVVFVVNDGTKYEFELSKAEALQRQLALHGASQKIGDSYASAAKEADPVAFAKACIEDTIKQLYAGDWKLVGKGTGPQDSLLVQAYARATGMEVEEARALLADATDDEKTALRKKPKVAAAIERIKLERQMARLEQAEKKAAEDQEGV